MSHSRITQVFIWLLSSWDRAFGYTIHFPWISSGFLYRVSLVWQFSSIESSPESFSMGTCFLYLFTQQFHKYASDGNRRPPLHYITVIWQKNMIKWILTHTTQNIYVVLPRELSHVRRLKFYSVTTHAYNKLLRYRSISSRRPPISSLF